MAWQTLAPVEVNGAAQGYRVRVARSEDAVDEMRDAWLRLQGDWILSDPDYYSLLLQHDPQIERPHVVLLEHDGEPAAMLVARLERARLRSRFGYRTIFSPQVRSLSVVQGGVLGDVDDDRLALLVDSLQGSLAAGEADVALFRYLPIESLAYSVASKRPRLLSRQHVSDPAGRWELVLPPSVDDLVSSWSRKTRGNMKREAKRLQQEFDLEIRRFDDPADADVFLRDAETVAMTTYQHGLGVSFASSPTYRERTRLCMERGWFRGLVLYLDDAPVAFWHGELYRGRFRMGTPGFDPQYARLGVGRFLLLRLIDDLCHDEQARIVDWGSGDAEYKARFGTRRILEDNVVVYAPRMKPVAVNLARTALVRSTQIGKALVDRTGLAARLKRRWRSRMTRKD